MTTTTILNLIVVSIGLVLYIQGEIKNCIRTRFIGIVIIEIIYILTMAILVGEQQIIKEQIYIKALTDNPYKMIIDSTHNHIDTIYVKYK